MGNFLQEHCNRYRRAGGDHATYIVVNDVDNDLAEQLKTTFEASHPPVSEEQQEKFREQLRRETKEAELRDDFEWLTGTGYYGQ